MENKKNVYIAQNASLVDHLGLTTYLRNIIEKLSEKKQYNLTIIPIKSSKKYQTNKKVENKIKDAKELLDNIKKDLIEIIIQEQEKFGILALD